MIALTLKEAAQAMNGHLIADTDSCFGGVCVDSRKIQPGQLFAALAGERADGHDFVPAALASGAVAVVVSREQVTDGARIVVDDVLRALGRLAAFWLRKIRQAGNLRVLALTGSNGKTTVKEMLTSILSRSGPVLKTPGNYNNELGLPLTLFGLSAEHRYAVLELGASRAGDIEYLVSICEPDVALVNNVGPAHLEGFGSLQGVAAAKGEIYPGLANGGVAVVNADEPWQQIWEAGIGEHRKIRFSGRGAEAEISAAIDAGDFMIRFPADRCERVRLPLPGAHNRMNALAAAAMAVAVGMEPARIRQGLEAVGAVAGRLNFARARGGWQVIDDSYNANPASLYAGLSVLVASLKEAEQAWLVLGDMAELGENSQKLHREMGAAAADLGVSRLFAVGRQAAFSVAGFGAGGRHFSSREELLEAILAELHPGVTCLVKGSRSMGMEKIARELLDSGNGDDQREVV